MSSSGRRPASSFTSSRLTRSGPRFAEKQLGGGRICPPLFLGPSSKNWLTNDFRRFPAAFYELDEVFGRHSGRSQGFPCGPLLPITPRPACPPLCWNPDGPSLCRDDLCAQRPEPQHVGDTGAGKVWPCVAR